MKKLYIISYNIHTISHDYFELYDEIKRLVGAGEYYHVLDYLWLVYTDKSAKEISDGISSKFYKLDSYMISEIGTDYQGWLPRSVWQWMNERITKSEE